MFKKVNEIKLLPMTNFRIKLAADIYHRVLHSLHNSDQVLYFYMIVAFINLSLKYGYLSDMPFSPYGTILIHGFGQYIKGFEFIELGHKFSLKTRTNPLPNEKAFDLLFFSCVINNWRYPIALTLQDFDKGYQFAVEGGDLYQAHICLVAKLLTSYYIGRPLSEVLQFVEASLAFQERFNFHKDALGHLTGLVLKSSLNLLLNSQRPTFSVLSKMKEDFSLLNTLDSEEDKACVNSIYVLLMKICYLLGSIAETVQLAEKFQTYMNYNVGFALMNGHLLTVLAFAAAYPEANTTEQRKYWRIIKKIQRQFKRWATWCPVNFKQCELLVSAEVTSLYADNIYKQQEAFTLYDQAIAAAEENENLYLIAIANERAAYLYFKLGKPKIAQLYLRDAHYAYSRWGAIAKAIILEKNYPESFHNLPVLQRSSPVAGTVRTMTKDSLDMMALFKSAQAIVSEIRLEKLLQNLLSTLLQSSGAKRGVLLLNENDIWYIKVEGTIEAQEKIIQLKTEPLTNPNILPLSLITYTQRTKQQLLIQNEKELIPYLEKDSYLKEIKPQSILILPLIHQDELNCILYLENKHTAYVFTEARLQVLELLAAQSAIALTNATLYHQATHDTLTGLANRPYLTQIFKRALHKANENNTMLAVLFLDLDGFKKINDTMGHAVGDKVLKYFAKELQVNLQEADLAVRLGGDEFILLLHNVVNLDYVRRIAQALLNRLITEVKIDQHTIYLRTSIGISLYPNDAIDLSGLLKKADTALYQVKQAGKGNYRFYKN